jgi:hypothetical protein
MDVHHHSHTARKRWSHYFWEFFMLFLAVFCGFLAEYQLEHVIEHNREKQYMKTLLEDLKKDTASLESSLTFWTNLSQKIDNTRPLLKAPSSETNNELIYDMAAMMVDFNDFIYFDRTIEQLRNSGNFRLIRKSNIADSLISYDSFIRTQLREQEATLLKILLTMLNSQNEMFDSDVLEYKFKRLKGLDPGREAPAHPYFMINNKEKLFKYYNDLFLYRSGAGYLINSINGLKNWATDLIIMIKREYHID